MKRPLVVALNPSVDVEWNVHRVRWEEKNDVLSERRWPGGKGVNVARWLKHLGESPRLFLPLGGVTGREMVAGLRREKLHPIVLLLREATRANVIVSAGAQGQLRFNPLGPRLTAREWRSCINRIKAALRGASVLVLSGSLPRDVPVDAYAQLIRLAHAAGVRTVLDCDGPRLSVAAPARPFLVKPNRHELEQWCGRALSSMSAVTKAARELSSVTGGWVLVSLGERGGVLAHAKDAVEIKASGARLAAVNTVGAGDALLAAVVQQIQADAPPREWLRQGVGVGGAATLHPAGQLPAHVRIRATVRRVTTR